MFTAKILYIKTVTLEVGVFVELVYDKRNVAGLPGAKEIILSELTKRVHRIFPDAEVKVKPMQANGLNSDASKSDREKLNRMLEDMFDESDMWLTNE
ncbi:virulence protein MsgA [Enterobacter roggenkampii]|nr:virulence protein MsgA [Enterobacter roggenkampii]KJN60083.1 virulence protein MsgA [Enterobacter roggenkampii]